MVGAKGLSLSGNQQVKHEIGVTTGFVDFSRFHSFHKIAQAFSAAFSFCQFDQKWEQKFWKFVEQLDYVLLNHRLFPKRFWPDRRKKKEELKWAFE